MTKRSIRKKWLIAAIVIASAGIVALLIRMLFFTSDDAEPRHGTPQYFPADYEENIFDNPVYRTFDRSVSFSVDGVEQSFDYEQDYASASPECRFFMDYFQALIKGDTDLVDVFYMPDCPEKPERFTMQMIHDIHVSFHSEDTVETDGRSLSVVNFLVQYRIYRNNGTFRKNVFNDSAVPQIYQLAIDQNGGYRIRRILEIEIKD